MRREGWCAASGLVGRVLPFFMSVAGLRAFGTIGLLTARTLVTVDGMVSVWGGLVGVLISVTLASSLSSPLFLLVESPWLVALVEYASCDSIWSIRVVSFASDVAICAR
ncbi:hypothetical protein AcV5_010481 [Taiwanofungus camphoratus]|nr:hypothetical protein AcV5_010481 [Antrodia cinnamomea]